MILKRYSLKLIFERASGYFLDCTTHLLNLINTFLVTLDKNLDVYFTYEYEKVLIAGNSMAQEGEK